jgi:hypothetical protein
MRWYSNYLAILKSASTIAEDEAGVIYRLAFEALKKYGIATLKEGVWTIEDDGFIYSIQEDASIVESNSLEDIKDDVYLPNNSVEEDISSIDFEAIKEGLEDPKEAPPVFEMEADTDDSEEEHNESTQETEAEAILTESPAVDDTNEEDNPFSSEAPILEEVNPFAFPSNSTEEVGGIPDDNPFHNEVNEELDLLNIPLEVTGQTIEISEVPDTQEVKPETPLNELVSQTSSNNSSSDEAVEISQEERPPQQFPLSLQSKDFTFAISGINSSNLSQQATFLIAPLRTDVEYPVSVVKAVINGNEFIYTTDSNGKIEFETDVYTYVIESIIKDGQFSPNVYVKDEDMDDFDHTQKTFGDKGHIALVDEEDDITVHIFPASFKENEYRTADFIYCIDTGDGDFFSDTNHKEKSALVKINGETFEITAKWKDSVLYAKIEQAQ